jgi:dihydrofolate reductase
MKTQMWKMSNLWVCGGEHVYKLLLPLCNELFLTIVLSEHDGDAFMPQYEDIFPYSEILKETKKYWLVRYWK